MAISESLTRYVRNNDAEAFAEIVAEYQALVFAVCRRRLRNAADVDDAVQETFLRLAKRASQLRTNLGGWLHTCAVNVSIDIERRRKYRNEHESSGIDEFEAEIDARAELAELREHLDAALLKLPQEDRELIIERFFVGKPQLQIASEAGVTPPVISNRLARAIDKLRVHLQAMGCITLTAGGVAILTGAMTAQHASAAVPSPLTANLMRIGLGKIAPPLKAWSAARIFLGGGTTAAILFVGWIIWWELAQAHSGYRAAEAPSSPIKAQPAATNDQNNLGEQILVARWYALLDDNAAKAIETLGTPKKSGSKLYHAMLFNAAGLRDALANTTNRNGVLATGREVDFGKMWPWDKRMELDPAFFIRLMARNPRRLTLAMDPSASAEFEVFDPPSNDSIHLVLNHQNVNLTLTELPATANSTTHPTEQAIVYDGQVKADEALGFLGTFMGASGTNYHLLVVWEAFRAQESQTSAFGGGGSGIPTDWWIANGPGKMRMFADIAVVWAARAKHAPDNPPAAYSVILPNGAGVQLLGLSNPAKFNFCWWDGTGDPIEAPMPGGELSKYGARDTGMHYSAQVRGSTNEPETPVPSNDNRPGARGWQIFSAAVRTPGSLKFTLGEGPWKQIGELDLNQPLIVDGITYSITTKTEVANDRFRVAFTRSIANGDLMALTALSDDGHEIGALGEGFTADGANVHRDSVAFTDLSLAHVKTFHMWLRKGHIVTFSNFAQSPNERPPETVTQDQIVAAAAILKAAHPELNPLWQPRNNIAASARPERPEAPAITPPGQIALPGHPSGIVCSPDGNWVFVALDRGVPGSTSGSDDQITVLRKSEGKFRIEHLVSIPSEPFGMVLTHDGKTLIVATHASVVLLDVGRMMSGAADPIDGEFSDGGNAPLYVNVTEDDKTLFVSNEGDGSISVIDLARTRAHPSEKPAIIGKIPVGLGPIALSFSPNGRWLYTTSQASPPEWGWAKTEKPEGAPSSQPSTLESPGAVIVIDVARARIDPAHSVVSRVPAGANPVRLTVSRDGLTAYVTARGSNAVLVFDAEKLVSDPANSRLATVAVGSEPVPLCLVSDGKILVVGNSNRMGSNRDDDTLSILDVRKNGSMITTIGTIPAGVFPREMCLSSDGQTLFVSNFRSNSLQVIDTRELPRGMN